ncbi:hypothetical protein [Rhizobium sp. IBUN]|uniref:hypothetical protein n=1 Tax=Rhizobium sp. IBUN TaxID=1042326 RepID=UPI0012EBF552|nr:hypothetical protein [Rhizobium sp. IBUN]
MPAGPTATAVSTASLSDAAPSRPFASRFTAVVEAPVMRQHPHVVRYADVFDALVDKAVAEIGDGEPVADEILGHCV